MNEYTTSMDMSFDTRGVLGVVISLKRGMVE